VLDTQPATRRVPGETLHPGVEPLLKQLGVWQSVLAANFLRHRGIWKETNGLRTFEPYGHDDHGPWLGFQVDRSQLNEILRARVVDLGGKINHTVHLDSVLEKQTAIAGIRSDGRTFDARFVLDATGRRSWLAGKLCMPLEKQPPTQHLRFGWCDDNSPELEAHPLFRQRKDGWDWLSPLGNGRCAWVKLRHSSTYRGIDYTWRIFRDCAGPGYFLLGDAACLMDPSAANGVLRALMSGIYAVHLISAVSLGAVTPDQAASEYRRWIGQMFDRSSKMLRRYFP
jgi:2-polyprenyl-6-methoxyphenol hydroxylase-like FAD-dependent oxidoreductase